MTPTIPEIPATSNTLVLARRSRTSSAPLNRPTNCRSSAAGTGFARSGRSPNGETAQSPESPPARVRLASVKRFCHKAQQTLCGEVRIHATSRIATYLSFCISSKDCRIKARTCRYTARASRVYCPCFKAFLLPRGAPEPGAPPCIRHRLFPFTAGDLQGSPERVLAPQRGLDNIGAVLRQLLFCTDILQPRLLFTL